LWFDVEKKYKTINQEYTQVFTALWFDVEKKYKTIIGKMRYSSTGCGLM